MILEKRKKKETQSVMNDEEKSYEYKSTSLQNPF